MFFSFSGLLFFFRFFFFFFGVLRSEAGDDPLGRAFGIDGGGILDDAGFAFGVEAEDAVARF